MKKSYDRTIGYSPLEDVDEAKMLQLIRANKRIIDRYYHATPADFVLVAGAGEGLEALLIGREYEIKTVGVDLNISQGPSNRADGTTFLQRQDISCLAFRDQVFSLIYCYHVLEHVTDHLSVLSELERVLSPDGVLFIGFPNKNRLVSYMGTSQRVTLLDRIKWNLRDYGQRLVGRFENRFAAHAGFAEREFMSLAEPFFPAVLPIRNEYMLEKYPRYARLIGSVIGLKLEEFIFPSNYFICMKH